MNGYNRMNPPNPHIEITEQPAPKALRFRYECEGRSAGSIPGVHSTPDNRTYPTIRIVGYDGPEDIVVVVSCVTKNQPYLAHPHNLVGKDCKEGVCTVSLDRDSRSVSFSNLGIQCVKKRDIEAALKLRKEKQVDPFGNKFDHMNNPSSIDLNCVRLCFQGIVKTNPPRLLCRAVSDPVYDKKAMSDLLITRLSHASASMKGGSEMMLLCEKITKEDIKVRFYQEVQGQEIWEAFADILVVHKQVAIVFKTPAYNLVREGKDAKVLVNIQLYRPSDKATSEPVSFFFTPEDSGIHAVKRPMPSPVPSKRSKHFEENTINQVLQVPGIYDIPQSNQQFQIKTEPCQSPASYYSISPSVTPGPSNLESSPAQVPDFSLPPFGETWTQPPKSESKAYVHPSLLGGGTITNPNAQNFNTDLYFYQQDMNNFMPSLLSNAQDPLQPYDTRVDQVANISMASVEQMVDSNDLIRPNVEPAQPLEQLTENFNNSMNISENSLSLNDFLRVTYEKFNNQA